MDETPTLGGTKVEPPEDTYQQRAALNGGIHSGGTKVEPPEDTTPTLGEPKNTGAMGTGSNQHEVRYQKITAPPTLGEPKNVGAVAGKTGTKGKPVLDDTPTLAEMDIRIYSYLPAAVAC